MKNTPLSYLRLSHERLNIFHRITGYMAIIMMLIHIVCYISFFNSLQKLFKLLEVQDVMGIISAISFLIVATSGIVIRNLYYELFYYIHTSSWMVSIVFLGLHQPIFTKLTLYLVILCSSLWLTDRAIRTLRLVIYSDRNYATITPLPNRGVRVTMHQPLPGAIPGQHCFLWIPKLRLCEAHPFTITSLDPVEFVVTARNGFTKQLFEFATMSPEITLKASIDGAYGSFPDPTRFDNIVLVAGGSGGSFAYGILRLLEETSAKQPDLFKIDVTVIWAVRHSGETIYRGFIQTKTDWCYRLFALVRPRCQMHQLPVRRLF